MTALEEQLTRALRRLSAQYETEQRRQSGQDASPTAANTVAAHHRKRSGEPVQTGLPKRGQRWDGGQRFRAIHVPPRPERRLIRPARLSMGTGTGSAVAVYVRLLRCFASFDRVALHPSVTRRAALYGFHPQSVSIDPSGTRISEADPRPSQRPHGGGRRPQGPDRRLHHECRRRRCGRVPKGVAGPR